MCVNVSIKPIEEVFVRTGRVLHLHLGDGQLIRTTPEHPFWVEELGWTPADMLRAGMRLATLGGEWVAVEEAFDTGEYETVYNCRVAEHHTYFVGDDTHTLAVWAHNQYRTLFIRESDSEGRPSIGLYYPFEVQAGTNSANAVPPSDIALSVNSAKEIVFRIINCLRDTFNRPQESLDTIGVAIVQIENRTEIWISQSGGNDSPITATRRKAIYQILTLDPIVRSYIQSRNIVVELTPSSPACVHTVKQVLNIDTHGTKDNHLNDAERHIYREISQRDGARLLAIGSTIPMCPICQAATEAAGLQYAIAVPKVSGDYLRTPDGWIDRRRFIPQGNS